MSARPVEFFLSFVHKTPVAPHRGCFLDDDVYVPSFSVHGDMYLVSRWIRRCEAAFVRGLRPCTVSRGECSTVTCQQPCFVLLLQ